MIRLAPLLFLVGCASSARSSRVVEGFAFASLACDYGQTMSHAADNWGDGTYFETNPMLGTSPGPAAVSTWFAVSAATLAIASEVSPRVRTVAGLLVIGIQAKAIAANSIWHETPLCGL